MRDRDEREASAGRKNAATMPTRIRTQLEIAADLRMREQCGRLGRELREGRAARRKTQTQIGTQVGLGQGAISRAERGLGGGLTLDAWQRIGVALGRPLNVAFQRDVTGEAADAGHLAMQELVLRLGRAAGSLGQLRACHPAGRALAIGRRRTSGRRAPAADPRGVLEHDRRRRRRRAPSERKRAEAASLAVGALGRRAPASVGVVWVVRATARNRALVARYPEVFAARFPGSSTGWVRALTAGRRRRRCPASPGATSAPTRALRLAPDAG